MSVSKYNTEMAMHLLKIADRIINIADSVRYETKTPDEVAALCSAESQELSKISDMLGD